MILTPSKGDAPRVEQSTSGGNLSGVSAGVSDLMALEKRKTLLLGPSVVSSNTLDFYTFQRGILRRVIADLRRGKPLLSHGMARWLYLETISQRDSDF